MSIAPGQIWKIEQADGTATIRLRRSRSSLIGDVQNIDYDSLGITISCGSLRHHYVVCGIGAVWMCLTPTLDTRVA